MGRGGQVTWMTNSFWSSNDKQLNKIAEWLEAWADKKVSYSDFGCHPGVTWQVPPQVISRPPARSLLHTVSRWWRANTVPAANNALWEETRLQRREPHQACAALTKTRIRLYISKLVCVDSPPSRSVIQGSFLCLWQVDWRSLLDRNVFKEKK